MKKILSNNEPKYKFKNSTDNVLNIASAQIQTIGRSFYKHLKIKRIITISSDTYIDSIELDDNLTVVDKYGYILMPLNHNNLLTKNSAEVVLEIECDSTINLPDFSIDFDYTV